MSRLSALNPTATIPSPNQQGTDLRDVDMDQFLKLLIAELQNQDPLNPMDNSEMIQQISQIREIGATNALTETLESVMLGQNIATASGLIGKHITALNTSSQNVEGVVDRVSVQVNDDDGTKRVQLHVGSQIIDLDKIREIVDG
jgi:flagellar basal-body rod modification protein FlgD